MAKIKWRKWNRAIHRDFGYFFFGMSVIYGLSGIALNHMRDFNPSYVITREEIIVDLPSDPYSLNKSEVLLLLEDIKEEGNYKKHYYPDSYQMKVFLKGGSVVFDLETGEGLIEKIKKRPILHEVNLLHYNPTILWTWFSDIYASALILLAVTGLFILRGKNGITRRGAWLTMAGVIIPIVFLILYL